MCTRMADPGGMRFHVFSCDFRIPEGNYDADCGSSCGIQAVRVNYGYGEYAIEPCTDVPLWVSARTESVRPRNRFEPRCAGLTFFLCDSFDRENRSRTWTTWCSDWPRLRRPRARCRPKVPSPPPHPPPRPPPRLLPQPRRAAHRLHRRQRKPSHQRSAIHTSQP